MVFGEGIRFTEEAVPASDYVIALNGPPDNIVVQCPPEHVWAILHEPPNADLRAMHRGQPNYHRIYTTDPSQTGPRYIHSQPALPWHVNKSYQELTQDAAPDKSRPLSWITSNLSVVEGHRVRLAFLEKIQSKVNFDLYGRGFNPIDDKWDGLAPYRYSIVVGIIGTRNYWSEKLADCFLAWTMPIYYGCTQITNWFPPEALICIDVNDPDAAEKINTSVASACWQQNQDAIAEARKLVLDRYQIFPFFSKQIHEHQQTSACVQQQRPTAISLMSVKRMNRRPLWERAINRLFRWTKTLSRRGPNLSP